MTQQSLTAPERETIISWSDAEDLAYIWTAQRTVITKLKANPAALLITEGTTGTTAWAEFRLPARLVSFRTRTIRRSMTTEQRRAAGARLAESRKVRQATGT